ncbi:MAG TPA: PLP-dependent transferase, partial [Dehalococcoidia bacterium]|nr:PLP-dependent transferase [Dehalococcoidia bacterium]
MDLEKAGPSTRAVHAGETPEPATGSLSPPLYQSSVYAFRDAAQGAALFAGVEEGFIYTRLGNPTLRTLE